VSTFDAYDAQADDDGWQEYKDNLLMGEPREEPDEEPPVDLDEVQAAFDECAREVHALGLNATTVAAALPYMIAELRASRAHAERRTGTRWMQHTVTQDRDTPPGPDAELVTPEQADAALANNASPRAVWARAACAVEEWALVSRKPPF
jgi:hypothetical protein